MQDHPPAVRGCRKADTHRSTPKNIGNILCLPLYPPHVVTDGCLALLNAGRDEGCQQNSNSGFLACQTIAAPRKRILPHCNYRTEETGTVVWQWSVTSGPDNTVVVDCSQTGYVGFTPKSAAIDEVATGCLGGGRLRAFAIGDHPLRPCRPYETQITIPAAVSDLR